MRIDNNQVYCSSYEKIKQIRRSIRNFVLIKCLLLGITVTSISWGQEISVEPASSVLKKNGTQVLDIMYDDEGNPQDLRGFSITFGFNPSYITTSSGDVVEGGFLKSLGDTRFFVIDKGAGEFMVDGALLGGDQGDGANGDGTLFSVTFTGTDHESGSSPINFISVDLRNMLNQEITVTTTGGQIYLDNTKPTMNTIPQPQGQKYNGPPELDLEFHDNWDLDGVFYQMDNFLNDWTPIQENISGTTYSTSWTLPQVEFDPLDEGDHTIYFKAVDDAGNSKGWFWQFIKDTSIPSNISSFSAVPGHNKIKLNWINDEAVAVKIMRKAWGDYPRYDDALEPTYPATYDAAEGAGWVQVYDGTGDSFEDDPVSVRDIYYYAAFAYEEAIPENNYANGTAGARGRASSYFLGDFHNGIKYLPSSGPISGDWTPDGYVDFEDLNIFSIAFYRTVSDNDWWDVCDIGPTTGGDGLDPPVPDGTIDFEDLNIFADNWHNVTPKASFPVHEPDFLVEKLTVSIKEDAMNQPVQGKKVVSVQLQNDGHLVKGINVVLDFNPQKMRLVSVSKGTFFTNSCHPAFFKYRNEGSSVQIDAAVLGKNIGIPVSGSVAELVFEKFEDGDHDIIIKEIDLRDVENQPLLSEIISSDELEVPKQFFLSQNFPNPFNNTTLMRYQLPVESRVKLYIYNNIGQVVQVLVDEIQSAGNYTVLWKGTNGAGVPQSSGMFFMVLKAGSFCQTRKIILLK